MAYQIYRVDGSAEGFKCVTQKIDAVDHPEGCHALECSGHGDEPDSQPRYRAAHLEEAQTAAPSSGVVQIQ
jgi:hypothetical protein